MLIILKILKTLVLILPLILFLLYNIASTSKNSNSDGMTAYRATFDACKLLISNKKRNRQEIKENEEILEKQPRRSNRNKINFGVVRNNVLKIQPS